VYQSLLPYWIAIIAIGTFFIAVHKGWLQGLFSFIASLFFKRPTPAIDLNWEVRRIRRLLEFFYFFTWLGIVLAFVYFFQGGEI